MITMRGDNTLDSWVEQHYGTDCNWVLLGYEMDYDVYETLPKLTVLDDECNEHQGIAIVFKEDNN